MPKVSEIKKGQIVEIDGQVFQARNINVRSPSSRGANTLYKITFMNLQKKQKLEQTLSGTDFLKDADCNRRQIQFLFKNDQFYTFMDDEDYNQYSISIDDLDDAVNYLTDGQTGITGMLYEGNLIGLDLPASVSLKIIETSPAIKGASASARKKSATLETGYVVQVPEYLAENEVVKVNTATGKFTSRA